jgi:hypothetical protein
MQLRCKHGYQLRHRSPFAESIPTLLAILQGNPDIFACAQATDGYKPVERKKRALEEPHGGIF